MTLADKVYWSGIFMVLCLVLSISSYLESAGHPFLQVLSFVPYVFGWTTFFMVSNKVDKLEKVVLGKG
jgi:hypothetical protein